MLPATNRAFLVCNSTQKCSSKEICAVLLSKNVLLANGQYISKKTVQIYGFKMNIPTNSNLLYNNQIINQFGVLVSFILGQPSF